MIISIPDKTTTAANDIGDIIVGVTQHKMYVPVQNHGATEKLVAAAAIDCELAAIFKDCISGEILVARHELKFGAAIDMPVLGIAAITRPDVQFTVRVDGKIGCRIAEGRTDALETELAGGQRDITHAVVDRDRVPFTITVCVTPTHR